VRKRGRGKGAAIAPRSRARGEASSAPPSAYERAVARLSRRELSTAELRRALERAGHAADEVESALLRLRAQGYVDDAAFAGRFARSRLAHQGHGRYRIREALRLRGVPARTADQGLAGALAEVPEAEALDAVARRYWDRRASVDPRLRLSRLRGVLLRRGFPAALVRDRLAALWPAWSRELEAEEPEDVGFPDGAEGFRE
jgi:regulatory protein